MKWRSPVLTPTMADWVTKLICVTDKRCTIGGARLTGRNENRISICVQTLFLLSNGSGTQSVPLGRELQVLPSGHMIDMNHQITQFDRHINSSFYAVTLRECCEQIAFVLVFFLRPLVRFFSFADGYAITASDSLAGFAAKCNRFVSSDGGKQIRP